MNAAASDVISTFAASDGNGSGLVVVLPGKCVSFNISIVSSTEHLCPLGLVKSPISALFSLFRRLFKLGDIHIRNQRGRGLAEKQIILFRGCVSMKVRVGSENCKTMSTSDVTGPSNIPSVLWPHYVRGCERAQKFPFRQKLRRVSAGAKIRILCESQSGGLGISNWKGIRKSTSERAQCLPKCNGYRIMWHLTI